MATGVGSIRNVLKQYVYENQLIQLSLVDKRLLASVYIGIVTITFILIR